jgi:hypothetical protein
MTSAAVASSSAAISIRAARLAIVAIASYQVLLIVLIFLGPDLAPSWHTISEWAIGPYGWIMSGAFLISAMRSAGFVRGSALTRSVRAPSSNHLSS